MTNIPSHLLNTIHHADALDILPQIPGKSIDLILIDPPYYKVVDNEWDNQWSSIKEYQEWLERFVVEFDRILKENGSILCFTDGENGAYTQVIFDKYFNLLNNLIFHKKDGFHNRIKCKYTPAYKGKKNNNEIDYFANDKSNTNEIDKGQIRSFLKSYEACLFYQTKLEAYKESRCILDKDCTLLAMLDTLKDKIRQKTGKHPKDIDALNMKFIYKHYFTYSQFMLMNDKLFNQILRLIDNDYPYTYQDLKEEYEKEKMKIKDYRYFNPYNFNMTDCQSLCWVHSICNDRLKENMDKFHTTQKPLYVIMELIQKTCIEGGMVLDCFSGSGTTAVACIKTNRQFIAIEKDGEYYKNSVERLNREKSKGDLFAQQPIKEMEVDVI